MQDFDHQPYLPSCYPQGLQKHLSQACSAQLLTFRSARALNSESRSPQCIPCPVNRTPTRNREDPKPGPLKFRVCRGLLYHYPLSNSLCPRNGMLSKTELSRFGSGMLTDVFVDRPAGTESSARLRVSLLVAWAFGIYMGFGFMVWV